MMGVKGIICCPIFVLFQIASCTVTKPLSLQYSVRDNATLKWTDSKKIVQVRFGLYDSTIDDISLQFVVVNTFAGVRYNNLTNTAYAGRVRFVGNLTLGHAWFKLLQLKKDDFKEAYVARILDGGETSYPVNLSLKAPVTTPTPSASPVPSSSLPTEPSSAPTKSPTTPTEEKFKASVIAGIVSSVIIALVAATFIGCYCCCPKRLTDCYNHVCCCCPCKIKAEGSSEEQGSEMKSKPHSAEK